MDQVFYEFKEVKNNADLSRESKIEIILHFLAKVEDHLILYETKQIISKKSQANVDSEVVNTLQKIIHQVDSTLVLVKGKIREIFLSYST